MAVNNIQKDQSADQSIFNKYKSDVSFFNETNNEDAGTKAYINATAMDKSQSLSPDYRPNLNILKKQSFQIFNYINETITSIEQILFKIYLNQTITSDLSETHSKLWEEIRKYNDISLPEPDFVSFEEYKYAERSMSTIARRFISEFNQVCSQSVFSYLLNFRSLLKAMLNEAYYIKNFLIVNFQEEYEDDSQKQVAIQFDAWAKVASQCTKRIVESITSSPSEIPISELGKVTEKQAVEFQTFFSIRLEAINEEVVNLLNNLKREYVDNCSIFYDRYLKQTLNFKINIVSPMELNYYTTTFSTACPSLTGELMIATNVMNANFGMVLSDLIQRNNIIKSKIEKVFDLVSQKRKYSNYIFQLSFKGKSKKIIIKKVVEDTYSSIYKKSYINYNEQSDLTSDHGNLDGLDKDHHPQYLLRDGGLITGDIILEKDIKIDGISPSKHLHTGIDGSQRIKSTDIDYETPRKEKTIDTPAPVSLEVSSIKIDITEGGTPIVEAILDIETKENDIYNYEYEISIYEV